MKGIAGMDAVKVLVTSLFGLMVASAGLVLRAAAAVDDGLVTADPYAEGLRTTDWMRAREASHRLGWTASLVGTPGGVQLKVTDRMGAPVDGQVEVTLSRPAESGLDYPLRLAAVGPGTWAGGPAPPKKGVWDAAVRVQRGPLLFLHRERLWLE